MNVLRQSTAVDVLIGPFLNDIDGNTQQTGLTIAAADVLLSKEGQGLTLKTDATACAHDAAGNYNCELDASDTNSVGSLVLTVHVAGALAVRHEFQVIEEAVFDERYAGGATGVISSNAVQISGDSGAADNLELMYDGTGYTDDTAPASRSQVDGIGAASGGALNYANEADNVDSDIKSVAFDGVETTGTNASVNAEDGSYHQIDDVANNIDIVYQFDIGGARTAVEIIFKGYLSSNNDVASIQAYNGSGWDVVQSLNGKNGSANDTLIIPLLSSHTGAGSDLGKVFLRIECVAQSNPTLFTDQLLVSAVNIGQSVGYANGSVWLDTVNGGAGTESFVNGVADNPVDLLASAKTIGTAVNMRDFHIINGSALVLAETSDNESYFGDNWTLDLNGQQTVSSHFEGAVVTGIQTGSGCGFVRGEIGTVTFADDALVELAELSGTITLPVGSVSFKRCVHGGSAAPILDFGGAVGSTVVHMHGYNGAIELHNFGDSGTDVLHLDGAGKVTVNANSTGGTIHLRGNWQVVDAAGTTTINYDDQSSGYANGQIWVDTNNGIAGINGHINGTAEKPVLTWADALTISAALGHKDYHVLNGSSITLTASSENYSMFGDHWDLALGGQACAGIYIQGATVSGIATSSGEEMHFEGCDVGIATLEQAHFDNCGFAGTVTMNTADDYEFHSCYDKTATAAVFTKTTLVNITAEWVNWSGSITISAIESGSSYILAGTEIGDVILNGANGSVEIRGIYKTLTDNRTGSPTLDITGAVKAGDVAAILADTNELQSDDIPGALAAIDTKIDTIDGNVDSVLEDTGTTLPAILDAQDTAIAAIDTVVDAILEDTGMTLPDLIAALQADTDDIQTRLPAALVSGLMSCDVTAISTSTTAADLLELSTLAIVSGIATGTPTTSTMAASALTEATNDHYVGRVIIWTSGDAKDIAAPISDYDGTTKTFTFPVTVTACAAADTFIII